MKKIKFFTHDKISYAVFLFLFILIIDLLAAISGFGGALFWLFDNEMQMFSSYESLILSVCVIILSWLIVIYSYRKNQVKKLKALGAVNLIMSLLPFFLNSVYYPFAYLTVKAVTDLLGVSSAFDFSDVIFFLSELISLPMSIACFALLFKLRRSSEEKTVQRISFRNLAAVTVLLFTLVTLAAYFVCNTPVSEYFNYSALSALIVESVEKSSEEKLFESITGDMDFSKAQELLKKEGYIPHTELEEYAEDEETVRINKDALSEILKSENEIAYTELYGDYISFYNSCVIISPDKSGKVKFKKIIYEDMMLITEKDYTAEAKEAFEGFVIGDDKKTVLDQMMKFTDVASCSVEYVGNTVKEVYDFRAYKNMGFLSLIDNVYFNATIVFENGILKDGNYTRVTESNYESDEVIRKESEYKIRK